MNEVKADLTAILPDLDADEVLVIRPRADYQWMLVFSILLRIPEPQHHLFLVARRYEGREVEIEREVEVLSVFQIFIGVSVAGAAESKVGALRRFNYQVGVVVPAVPSAASFPAHVVVSIAPIKRIVGYTRVLIEIR